MDIREISTECTSSSDASTYPRDPALLSERTTPIAPHGAHLPEPAYGGRYVLKRFYYSTAILDTQPMSGDTADGKQEPKIQSRVIQIIPGIEDKSKIHGICALNANAQRHAQDNVSEGQ